MRTLLITVLAACLSLAQQGQAAALRRGGEGSPQRSLVVAPKDVYSVKINNLLTGSVNATVTFSKGTTNELLVEKKSIAPGGAFLSGPYDFQEGSASFHYIVQAVRVRRLMGAGETPMGVGAVPNAPQESLQLTAPFENVQGVTPLLEVDVVPLAQDAEKKHLGALTTRLPSA